MTNIKKYTKVLILPLITVLTVPIILAILNLLGFKTYNFICLLIILITSLISGYKTGKIANHRGYINGLIYGSAFSLILFLISLLFKNNYAINTLIYYLIIILSFTIGSMFGIQKKL